MDIELTINWGDNPLGFTRESGEAFFRDVLDPNFAENPNKITILMYRRDEFPEEFVDAAFRPLGKKYGYERCVEVLNIETNDPNLLDSIDYALWGEMCEQCD